MTPAESWSVSVVTPLHNAGQLVHRVVASVRAQTLKPIEHILVDDGSTDGTYERARFESQRSSRVRVIAQAHAGVAVARNVGIEAAQGRYVAFLDCDDVWLPDKLQSQVSFMALSGTAFSYGDYLAVDAMTGHVLARHRLPKTLGYSELLDRCPIGCLTAAYDQTMLGKRYMPLVHRGQDWGLWLELTRDGVLARKYPRVLAHYAVAPGSLSSSRFAKARDLYTIYRDYEAFPRPTALLHLCRHAIYGLTHGRTAARIRALLA